MFGASWFKVWLFDVFSQWLWGTKTRSSQKSILEGLWWVVIFFLFKNNKQVLLNREPYKEEINGLIWFKYWDDMQSNYTFLCVLNWWFVQNVNYPRSRCSESVWRLFPPLKLFTVSPLVFHGGTNVTQVCVTWQNVYLLPKLTNNFIVVDREKEPSEGSGTQRGEGDLHQADGQLPRILCLWRNSGCICHAVS